MRKKIIIFVSFILIFFIGAGSNYILIKSFPPITKVINKIEKVIEIEEVAVEEAINKAYDAVVVVESFYNKINIASGTGFVYKQDEEYGYIMTNSHVVDEGDETEIIFSNGKRVTAILLGNDELADIAVLRIDKDDIISVVEIGSSQNLELGNTVIAIGAPMGSDYSGTVTKGIVSGMNRLVSISIGGTTSDWLMSVIQTDAAISPGNSGGPLLNLAGEVVGINSLKLVDENVEGIGFAIPIEESMEYVDYLEKGEIINRPFLGVQLLDVDETYALFYNNITIDDSVLSGAVIQSVIKNSAAFQAGLKKGDVILQVEEEKIENKAELRYQLYKYKVGDNIILIVYRDNDTIELEVTLRGTEE
jgi:serine protease Do